MPACAPTRDMLLLHEPGHKMLRSAHLDSEQTSLVKSILQKTHAHLYWKRLKYKCGCTHCECRSFFGNRFPMQGSHTCISCRGCSYSLRFAPRHHKDRVHRHGSAMRVYTSTKRRGQSFRAALESRRVKQFGRFCSPLPQRCCARARNGPTAHTWKKIQLLAGINARNGQASILCRFCGFGKSMPLNGIPRRRRPVTCKHHCRSILGEVHTALTFSKP